MMTPEQKIRKRMQRIIPHSRAYFMKNENNIRLCHIEGNQYKYIVFPFCDYKALTTAAQLLKDCGIVDGYKEMKIDNEHFYVELIEFKYRRHTDAKGKTMSYKVKQVKEWSELRLTTSDVQHFIARFELANPATHYAPVIPMFPKHTPQKRIA